eukprot:c20811_g2_i3.p1 GENE.c20811_g2_i3~~c20811_g2_i3.p1  ORF type:complete len:533 (-),score=153.28 c20811_g2_i3:248-1633(-)
MADLQGASSLLAFLNSSPQFLHDRPIKATYSTHQKLDRINKSRAPRQDKANRILLATIHHCVYPMTVDVISQVFSPHGQLEKIVVFQKTQVQALVQYSSVEAATKAIGELQGQYIYQDACRLDIVYSRLTELSVKRNNELTRDFTNPNLDAESTTTSNALGLLPNPNHSQPTHQHQQQQQQHSQLQQQQLGQTRSHQQSSSPLSGGLVSHRSLHASAQPVFPPPSHNNVNLNGQSVYLPGAGGYYSHTNQTLPQQRAGYGCVLLVSNLNAESVTCDVLFNLFSSYGAVTRVKVFYSKRDHALIQMGDTQQATLAIHHLKGAVVFGKPLQITISKHASIRGGDGEGEAHDNNNNALNTAYPPALNRFRANFPIRGNFFSPSPVLHLSNLPESVTEALIREKFVNAGTVKHVNMFEHRGKQICLVEFDSVATATSVICTLNNSDLGGKKLRIAFSRTPTSSRS